MPHSQERRACRSVARFQSDTDGVLFLRVEVRLDPLNRLGIWSAEVDAAAAEVFMDVCGDQACNVYIICVCHSLFSVMHTVRQNGKQCFPQLNCVKNPPSRRSGASLKKNVLNGGLTWKHQI